MPAKTSPSQTLTEIPEGKRKIANFTSKSKKTKMEDQKFENETFQKAMLKGEGSRSASRKNEPGKNQGDFSLGGVL